jgi:type II secretory pathway component PulJ
MNSPARVSPQCSRHTPCAVALLRLSCRGIQWLNHYRIERADGTRDPLAGAPLATLRRGLSLMELLIATTISIMLMAATVTLFGVVGDKVNAGRAMIETGDRLRATRNRLSADLRGATVSFLPWEQASSGSGYFEVLKGPPVDTSNPPTSNTYNVGSASVAVASPNAKPFNRDANASSTLVGYTQDVLMLTTRSRDVPFTGRAGSTTIESQVAEVVWYVQPTFNAQGQLQPTYTLYRRQFLVCPVVNNQASVQLQPPAPSAANPNPTKTYYDNFDISSHPLYYKDPMTGTQYQYQVFNSLSDLAYRENRFAHNTDKASAGFPNPVLGPTQYNSSGALVPAQLPLLYSVNSGGSVNAVGATNYDSLTPFQATYMPDGSQNLAGSQRYGEDVVLTNVLSFDIKLWDPGAEVKQDVSGSTNSALVPSDPGYRNPPSPKPATSTSFNPKQYGAYVDLNYSATTYPFGMNNDTDGAVDTTSRSFFAGPYYGSGQTSSLWAGRFTSGFATFDTWSLGYEYGSKSVNGFDNDSSNGVNDAGERVTSPPYPVPLRGVQIKIRVYEPTSRQVREVTVTETFLPD